MVKTVVVSIRVKEDEKPSLISDTIVINSKHEIFKIPVSANIVTNEEFGELFN